MPRDLRRLHERAARADAARAGGRRCLTRAASSRCAAGSRLPAADRALSDHRHQAIPPAEAHVREQAARCMGCGVPFCHTGCPLDNIVPDWNELVRTGL